MHNHCSIYICSFNDTQRLDMRGSFSMLVYNFLKVSLKNYLFYSYSYGLPLVIKAFTKAFLYYLDTMSVFTILLKYPFYRWIKYASSHDACAFGASFHINIVYQLRMTNICHYSESISQFGCFKNIFELWNANVFNLLVSSQSVCVCTHTYYFY